MFGTTTGGAYSGGGSVNTLAVTATSNSTTVTITNLPDSSTVGVSGANDINTAFIDTAAGATLAVNLGDSQAGATAAGDVTVQDAANVTIGTTVATSAYDDLALDALIRCVLSTASKARYRRNRRSNSHIYISGT